MGNKYTKNNIMSYINEFVNEGKTKKKKKKGKNSKVILDSRDGIVERIDVKRVVQDGRELLNG